MLFITRAVKYFLSIFVLSAVLIAGLYAFDLAAGTPADLIHMLFQTPKGWIFLGAVLVLSLIYPRIGFMKVHVPGEVAKSREQIDEAFRSDGFIPVEENDSVRLFRASNLWLRIRMRFDDTVAVRQHGPWIELDGPRKIVARIQYRLENYIRQQNE